LDVLDILWLSLDVKPTEHSEGQGHTVAGLRGRSLRGTDFKHPKHAGWDRNIPVFFFISRPQVVWEGTSPCCQYLKYLGSLGLGTSAAQAALERMDMISFINEPFQEAWLWVCRWMW